MIPYRIAPGAFHITCAVLYTSRVLNWNTVRPDLINNSGIFAVLPTMDPSLPLVEAREADFIAYPGQMHQSILVHQNVSSLEQTSPITVPKPRSPYHIVHLRVIVDLCM